MGCRLYHLYALLEAGMDFTAITVDSGTCGLVATTSASHAEGRQFDPGQDRSRYAACVARLLFRMPLSNVIDESTA